LPAPVAGGGVDVTAVVLLAGATDASVVDGTDEVTEATVAAVLVPSAVVAAVVVTTAPAVVLAPPADVVADPLAGMAAEPSGCLPLSGAVGNPHCCAVDVRELP